MAGQIIIVTGTSGAGKTTTCTTFADRSVEPYLTFGFDMLVGSMFPARFTIFGEERDVGYAPTHYGPMCMQATRAMHEMIAAAARVGQSVIVDHITFTDPPVLQDCIWRLTDVPVLFVCLKPPPEVLAERVRHRTIDFIPPPIGRAMAKLGTDAIGKIGEELASVTDWFYEHAYANDCYDLTLDTSRMSADDVCDRIDARLREGPGTAFATLRERYPDPRPRHAQG